MWLAISALLAVAVVACSKPEKRAHPQALCDASGSDRETELRRGADLIRPHMILVGRKPAPRNDDEIRVGIACLDHALRIDPSNWSALWIRGKGLQALGEHTLAVESFLAAYRLHSDDPEMGRELGAELLETGRFPEAVRVARSISDRRPQDAGMKANVALAQLLAGDIAAAQQTVAEALKLDPNDSITKALAQVILDVSTGKRPRPKSLHELQRGR
jgi:tetratricopeptide (TPR) repeat protein